MICEITTLTIYHHFKSFLNLWRKICNRKSILTSSNCNVKRKCRTLLFVDYLVQFKYSLICYTFPFLMRLNYFAKQFLRNYGRLILKRDSLIHRSIDFRSFHSSSASAWAHKKSERSNGIFVVASPGISLKSESICLITSYVVVFFGFRFVLFIGFNALHQPRVSAGKSTNSFKYVRQRATAWNRIL